MPTSEGAMLPGLSAFCASCGRKTDQNEVMELNYTVTGSQMKQLDQETIGKIGIPSMVLMERAALAVAGAVEQVGTGEGNRVLIACGAGNNGADGIAVGRILHGRGWRVTVLLAGNPEHATAEHAQQRRIAEKMGVCLVSAEDYVPGECQVIVDALFGIGLKRAVEGRYQELLSMLEDIRTSHGAKVVAVDIASGIHADTGAVMGTALSADVTVTFGYAKTGQLLYPGKEFTGRLMVEDIGFPKVEQTGAGWDTVCLEEADLKPLRERRADGNKGTFGKVLVVAGCRGMSGASYLCALAAYRAGAGIVKILTVPENRAVLQSQLPEAIVAAYEPEEAGTDTMREFLEQQCDWADAIALGPGIGQEPYVEYLLETILSHAYVPIVLDADGLNAVAAHPYLTRYFTENIIITPHMGEMARLCGCPVPELKADPVQAAREYSARYEVVCVLKDAVTVTADKDGRTFLNTSGCSAMAKGGSGDVLTGLITGLLARGTECAEAAAAGVFLHGLAGERAAQQSTANGLLAHEIADRIFW